MSDKFDVSRLRSDQTIHRHWRDVEGGPKNHLVLKPEEEAKLSTIEYLRVNGQIKVDRLKGIPAGGRWDLPKR